MIGVDDEFIERTDGWFGEGINFVRIASVTPAICSQRATNKRPLKCSVECVRRRDGVKTVEDDLLNSDGVVGILAEVCERIERFDIINVIFSGPNITDRVALEGVTVNRVMGDVVDIPEVVLNGLARGTAGFIDTIDGQVSGVGGNAER